MVGCGQDYKARQVRAGSGQAWQGVGYKEESNMTRQDKIKALTEYVSNMEYGNHLMHHDIEELIKEKHKTNRYKDIVDASKKRLLSMGKMIENVKGIGYRIVSPDNYTEQAVKQVMSGAKRIAKGATIMDSAPVKDMTSAGLEAYNATADRMRILHAAVVSASVEVNMLASKRPHPLSIDAAAEKH